MVALWCVAVAATIGYYTVPGVAALLEPLANWQRENGAVAAFTSLAVFCGVIPYVFLCSVKSLRPRHPLATMLVMSVWCGTCFFRTCLQTGSYGYRFSAPSLPFRCRCRYSLRGWPVRFGHLCVCRSEGVAQFPCEKENELCGDRPSECLVKRPFAHPSQEWVRLAWCKCHCEKFVANFSQWLIERCAPFLI